MVQATRWVFTINNPEEDEEDRIRDFFRNHCKYGIFGREVGDSGTPHLQGFVILNRSQRLTFLRGRLSPRGHYERAQGTNQEASDYCKKDNDYEEHGTCPSQGSRTDIVKFKEWVTELDHKPSDREVAREFPSLWLRYPKLTGLIDHLRPMPELVDGDLREWQQDIESELEGEPDDRTVTFVVDYEGGKGKSWFVRYWLTCYPEETQVLSVGKRDDLAFCIDETKKYFLFDLPRGSMEFFQYGVAEKLKDQLIFSPKYQSRVKILEHKCHVIVFCNEDPNMEAMSHDRYNIIQLD